MPNDTAPFSQRYVLSVTVRNMRQAIDVSSRKTIARLAGFNSNQELSAEALETLASLNRLHLLLDDIVNNNPNIFKDEKAQ